MEKWKQEKVIKLFLYLTGIAFLAFFILHAVSFSLHDDDFWVLHYCNSGSLTNDFNFWWHHNNGRYASAFFQLIFFRLPQNSIAISSALLCLILIYVSVFRVLKSLSQKELLHKKNYYAFSILITAAIYYSSPNINDVFFWPSSIFVHGFSVAAFIFIVSFLIESKSNLHYIFAAISAIFLGGASETSAILSIFVVLFSFLFGSGNRIQVISVAAIIMVGLVIHYFAPASSLRSEDLLNNAPQGFLKAIFISAYYNVKRVFIPIVILFFMLWPVIEMYTEKLKSGKLLHIWLLLPAAAAIIHSIFIGYVMRDAEPSRAAQAVFILLIPPILLLLSKIWKTGNAIYKILPALLVSFLFLILQIVSS